MKTETLYKAAQVFQSVSSTVESTRLVDDLDVLEEKASG